MSATKFFDVVTIGGGVAGCAIARTLSRYNISQLVLDALTDVGMGTTKANSGIVHAGFNNHIKTLKGQLEYKGNRMINKDHKDMGFGYKECGELVVVRNEADWETIKEMEAIAESKGVPIEIWDQKKLQKEEPNLSKKLLGALFGPTGGVINPWEYAFSLREVAEQNGGKFQINTTVQKIDREADGTYIIHTNNGTFAAGVVINAAGVFADKIANMVGDKSFVIKPRKGEEYLMDKSYAGMFERVIFPVPTATSKGTLIIPTVDRTLMIGPSADEVMDRWDLTTSNQGVDKIFKMATDLSDKITQRGIIAQFAGLRAVSNTNDFIIEQSKVAPHFYHCAGIQSPGLTAAPAIAEYVLEQLKKGEKTLGLKNEKHNFLPSLSNPIKLFMNMNDEEQVKIVEKDPLYGDVVCRCEFVTVGDVKDAIKHGAETMDGVKFRTRAGMGKCQGGFCSSRVMEMLAHARNVPLEEISKFGKGSNLAAHQWNDPRRSKLRQRQILKKRWDKETEDEKKASGSENMSKGRALKEHLESKVYDVLVIGGGAAGLAAAKGAKEYGAKDVAVFDREPVPGGILLQCIHSGFGLKYFKEELTGPEYANRVEKLAHQSGAEVYPVSFCYKMQKVEDGLKEVKVLIGSELGGCVANVKAKSVVLAMGSRERTRQEIKIPGSRPAGVYNAGLAQKMINEMGVLPGKKAVILGSGDIGLIMARRLVLEGCQVQGCYELLNGCSGLKRNKVQCLDDYNIPLKVSHTVVKIHGKERVEKVTIAPVDPKTWAPIMEKAFDVECDLLLLSVGLIPNNDVAEEMGLELNPTTKGAKVTSEMMTNLDGVFSAGNVLHIHDIVDNVTQEGLKAGRAAVMYNKNKEMFYKSNVKVEAGTDVGYVVPAKMSTEFIQKVKDTKDMPFTLSLRAKRVIRGGADLQLIDNRTGEVLYTKKEELVLPAEMIIVELKKKQIEKMAAAAAKSPNGVLDMKVVLKEHAAKKETKKAGKKIEGIETASTTDITCVCCPEGCEMKVFYKGQNVLAVEGNKCKTGLDYAKQELLDPRRVFSTTITSVDDKVPQYVTVIPVKLTKSVPKRRILEIVKEMQKIKFDKDVKCGQTLATDIAGEKGVNVIACRDAKLVDLN